MPVTSKRKKLPYARITSPLRMLPIDRLIPTPDNRRRPITQASVESLARSITRDGVIHPIVVRPHPGKMAHWEIRAGERRWRAAKLAGLTHMPAIIRELDDPAALSVTIAENIQRQDLHPLEEAATIQQAFDRGYDVKAVASRLGKSVQYVARRASLTRLAKVWRDEVFRPESDAGRFSVAHLEQIARLPEETQQVLAADGFAAVFGRGFPTVAELQRLIDGGLHSLQAMPWPLDDETVEPKAGSCLNCPKRSGMHPMLFDAEDAPRNGKVSKTDRCLDPACFDRKQSAFVQRCEAGLRAEHPDLRLVQIGYGRLPPATQEAFGDRITQVYQPRIVKAGRKGATPAMQVDGPKAGTLIHIDFGDSVSRNGTASKAARKRDASGKPVPMPLADRRARLQKRRDAFLVQKVGEQLRGLTPEALTATAAAFGKRTDRAARRFDPLALVLAFGTSSRADRDHDDGPWTRYEELIDRKKDVPIAAALQEVVQVWVRRLGGSDTHHTTEQAADARRVCELLGIDAAAIETESVSAIPTPKSWTGLAEEAAEAPPFEPTPARKNQRRPQRGKGHRAPTRRRGKGA